MDVKLTVFRSKNGWLLAAAGALAVILTASFLLRAVKTETYSLRFCMGEEMTLREDILKTLHEEAAKKKLKLKTSPGTRGEDSVNRVLRGEQDVAIIFGGLGIEHPDLRQVACLRGEPLHLFVKPEIAALGLAGIQGKRINVGPIDGETQVAVKKIFQHMGIKGGVDFTEEHHSIKQLSEMPHDELPDGLFASAGLPWAMGRTFVHKHGYKILEIPFGEVLSLRNPVISNMTIPANTYGYNPAVPEKAIQTVGTYVMVIAHKNTPSKAVYRLLELLCESEFPRRIGKTPIDPATMVRVRDYPLHEGAVEYLNRNEPVINNKVVEQFTSLRDAFMAGASALLFFWGWIRRRPSQEYTVFLRQATQLEIEATQACVQGTLDGDRRAEFLGKILSLKVTALEAHRMGQLPGDKPLDEFLARVEHVRISVANLPARDGGESARATDEKTYRAKAG